MAQVYGFSLTDESMGNYDFKAHKEAGGTRNHSGKCDNRNIQLFGIKGESSFKFPVVAVDLYMVPASREYDGESSLEEFQSETWVWFLAASRIRGLTFDQ